MALGKLDGGYLMLDNRNNQGMSEEATIKAGLPIIAQSGLFEASTITCNHCNVIVVINPERTRERPFCVKCNHYICDKCKSIQVVTGECRTMAQVLDEYEASLSKQT